MHQSGEEAELGSPLWSHRPYDWHRLRRHRTIYGGNAGRDRCSCFSVQCVLLCGRFIKPISHQLLLLRNNYGPASISFVCLSWFLFVRRLVDIAGSISIVDNLSSSFDCSLPYPNNAERGWRLLLSWLQRGVYDPRDRGTNPSHCYPFHHCV